MIACPSGSIQWDGGEFPADCHGNYDPTVNFLVEDALFLLTGWTGCPTEEDPLALCANYNRPPFVVRAVLPWAPRSCIPLRENPPVGSVWLTRISSINGAGMRDDGTCL